MSLSIPSDLWPHRFDERLCRDSLPPYVNVGESRAHRALKIRLARAALAAGWRVAFETAGADVVALAPDGRAAALEAVCSPTNNIEPRRNRYKQWCGLDSFWFIHPRVRYEPCNYRFVVNADLRAVVERCLQSVQAKEAPLPSAWRLRTCAVWHGRGTFADLLHDFDMLPPKVQDRLARACRAAVRDVRHGSEIAATIERVCDASGFDRLGLSIDILTAAQYPRAGLVGLGL